MKFFSYFKSWLLTVYTFPRTYSQLVGRLHEVQNQLSIFTEQNRRFMTEQSQELLVLRGLAENVSEALKNLGQGLTMLQSSLENSSSAIYDIKGNVGDVGQAVADARSDISAAIYDIKGNVGDIRESIPGQLKRALNKTQDNILKTADGRIWTLEQRLTIQLRNDLFNISFMLEKHINRKTKMQQHTDRPILTYNKRFYDDNRFLSVLSARETFKYLLPPLGINSIVDFGCGSGAWLYVAQNEFGVSEILGLDGNYIDREALLISEKYFLPCDLTAPVNLYKKFVMAMSMEVAEHLPEDSAQVFVESLCRHSDVVLFSAAHIGQGGDGHINEQPFEYWQKKFEAQGFRLIEVRTALKDRPYIASWYKDNIALYVQSDRYFEIMSSLASAK